jgi:MerR family transcriptional regulator/heat shock protein HspR
MRDPARGVFVISVAAELAGVHPQTLRIYERKGLVDPARTDGGNRRYSEEDIELLRRIQDLTASGLNLAGVKQVLALEAKLARLEVELEAARAEARSARRTRVERRDLVPLAEATWPFGNRSGTR